MTIMVMWITLLFLFSSDQISRLLSLLNERKMIDDPRSNMVGIENLGLNDYGWIIDSEAN